MPNSMGPIRRFFHNALDRQTDGRTDRLTDCSRESLRYESMIFMLLSSWHTLQEIRRQEIGRSTSIFYLLVRGDQ